MIVLDETAPEMSETQLDWLEGELQAAKSGRGTGDRDRRRGHRSPDPGGAQTVGHAREDPRHGLARNPAGPVRTAGKGNVARAKAACSSASAYFYDAREQNEHKPLRAGGESIEAYGSGTLGYINKRRTRPPETSTERAGSCWRR